MTLRVLLLADTHLGFDHPLKPRVRRRHRGPDFVANLDRALAPALEGRVHLVLHGGDVFHTPRVPASIVTHAIDRFRRVAERVPVVVVAGNHERSVIPMRLCWGADGLHILDEPSTIVLNAAGRRVAISGFPFSRTDLRRTFSDLVDATGWRTAGADIRLLLMHHTVEGATVGPADYTFRRGRDVVPGRRLPAGFDAILSGHIHRAQVLERGLDGRPFPCPVIYPGSIERTSFAERDEPKSTTHLIWSDRGDLTIERCPLPARPMTTIRLDVTGRSETWIEAALRSALAEQPDDAIIRLQIVGDPGPSIAPLRAAALRGVIRRTQTLETSWRSPAIASYSARDTSMPSAGDRS